MNTHRLHHITNFRSSATLVELCDADQDFRAYVILVEIGRYGRFSLDPKQSAEVLRFEGTYLGGLGLDRAPP
jgi:hypothetical protein